MKILKINSSAQKSNSISRNMVEQVVTKLKDKYSDIEIQERDVAYSNLPYINQDFVEAMFYKGNLSKEQKEVLQSSDMLIDELISSDMIVLGAPIYNFSIPSSLKSYFDLVSRPGRTFNFDSMGRSTGLMKDKMAIIVISSGGTQIDSKDDFTKGYLKKIFDFIGITRLEFIEMDQVGFRYNEKLEMAKSKLDTIIKS
jgi:FMN-dependent NADH-azoreductase